ncbi:MAG TPA: class I SAM-dependent methyltransferase [Polyangiaceae bacterium]|nr:class I SAM-dependent methyltransferase [Polyangiaceae bacterium]
MNVARHPEDDQHTLWNGPAGRTWAEAQGLLDRFFEPIEGLLADAVAAAPRALVLDVGCGTGATTVAAARRLGAGGRCVGVDLSGPMLEVARARAEREGVPATFVLADAQAHAFEPASFDLIISRFGVMFFDDPVRAFANLRRAARDDAELRLVAWRSAEDNPFMTTAERAAAPLVPNLPARRPDGPGQFAFADRSRVQHILEGGGWTDVDVRAIDIPCTLPEKELVPYLTRLGPLGRALSEVDEQTRARVLEVVRPAFDPYVHGDEVRVTAACWLISGRASAGSLP